MSGRGRIRIIADVPSACGYVDASRSTSGSYLRTVRRDTALVISYKPNGNNHNMIVLPNANDNWLAITWPNLTSSQWPLSKGYAASLVKSGRSHKGDIWSTHSQSAGATQYLIWKVKASGELVANYVENNGTSHELQAYVNVEGWNIKFTRKTSDLYWRNQNPGWCKARLAFEPSDATTGYQMVTFITVPRKLNSGSSSGGP